MASMGWMQLLRASMQKRGFEIREDIPRGAVNLYARTSEENVLLHDKHTPDNPGPQPFLSSVSALDLFSICVW